MDYANGRSPENQSFHNCVKEAAEEETRLYNAAIWPVVSFFGFIVFAGLSVAVLYKAGVVAEEQLVDARNRLAACPSSSDICDALPRVVSACSERVSRYSNHGRSFFSGMYARLSASPAFFSGPEAVVSTEERDVEVVDSTLAI